MHHQVWKRTVAALGIITILFSNMPDLMTVHAAENETAATAESAAAEAATMETEETSAGEAAGGNTDTGEDTDTEAAGIQSAAETSSDAVTAATAETAGPDETVSTAETAETAKTSSTAETAGREMTASTASDTGKTVREVAKEDKSVSLSGSCKADGSVIEGHEVFAITFEDGSSIIDADSFAPSIEGYSYTGSAKIENDQVSQIRKITQQTKENVDGEEIVSGETVLMQYTADPSDEGSWKDLTSDAQIVFEYTKDKQKTAASEIRLTAECVDAADGSVIDGHAGDIFPDFEEKIDLTKEPFIVEGYTYKEAKIGGSVAAAVQKSVRGEGSDRATVYSWISNDGSRQDLASDTTITLVYEKIEQIDNVKVTLAAVDEEGKAIEGFEHPALPSFDKTLAFDDKDDAPVSIEGYDYVSAKIGDTAVTALSKETKKSRGEDVTVYSYTADGKTTVLKDGTEITLSYKAQAKEVKLTAAYVDKDGAAVEGYEDKDEMPSFDGTLALADRDSEPFGIKDWIYKEARIGDTIITSISKETKKAGIHDIDVYSYTADGKTTDIDKDTKITFVYEPADKVVKVDASCVDEFGDAIDDKFSNVKLSEFDESGKLVLNDTDTPPVKGVQVWKGLFKLVRYNYVQATVNGTIITSLKKEKAKIAKKTSYTGDRGEAYVYSYTEDGSKWTKITADTTVKFEYTDGKKTTFTYEDDNVVVTATLQHAGAIPDDAELKVTPVTANTDGYNYDAYMQALNDNSQQIAASTGAAASDAPDAETAKTAADAAQQFTADNTLLYDIAFLADKTDDDGNVIEGEKQEIEPTEGMVKISMTFKQKQLTEDLDAKTANDVAVVHLPLDTSVKESADTTKDATNISVSDVKVEIVSDDASVNAGGSDQVDFNLSSMSVLAFARMMLLGAGNTHNVTFSVNGSTELESFKSQTVEDGGLATKPNSNPPIGTIEGWYTSTDATGTEYSFATPVKADLTLYARINFLHYFVTNTTYNYADDDMTHYTVDKNADITITNAGQVVYKKTVTPGETFDIPANTTFEICTHSTTEGVTVTMVPDTDKKQSAIGPINQELHYPSGSGSVSATFKSQEPASNINLYKQWEDGADSKKDVTLGLSLDFSTNTGTTWTNLSESNMASLGYTALPEIPTHAGNVSEWSYAFYKTLNEYTTDGTKVIYRLHEDMVPKGYVSSYVDGDATNNTLVNTKFNPYAATKKWADGSNAYSTRQEIAEWIGTLTCKKSAMDQSDETVNLTTTDENAEGYITVNDNRDNTWTISMPNARGYDGEDYPYSYYLTENPVIAGTSTAAEETTYEATYLNEGNYASITTALYTGGTATNTLTNTMTFTGTKKWADDIDSKTIIAARPTATVTLYRYPDTTGQSYETASPVEGNTTATLDNAKTEAFSFTLPTDGAMLPMYNDDGYRYIYFAKETLSGGTNDYKQVFVNNGTAAGNDKFLFNGGELDNTIAGTVDLTGTKTWVAAARQDVDAQVEMKVYQLDQDDISKSGVVATKMLTDFGTENPSKTVTFTGLPKYNSNGHQYIYTVMEGAVTTKVGSGFESTVTKNVDGTRYLITTDGYRYRQDLNQGVNDTTIENVLVGNAQVKINKTFPDGLLANPTKLTYTIYRNGTAIGTKTISYTGSIDGKAFTPDPVVITSYEDLTTKTDVTATGLLPRYDDNGVQYKYSVEETLIDPAGKYSVTDNNSMSEGTYAATDPDYADEKYLLATATISNSGSGAGMEIKVNKTWIDASDLMNRQTVQVALEYTADGSSWSEVAKGAIGTKTDYVRIGVPDIKPEGSDSTYQDLYKAWVTAKKPSDAAGAFRVRETALGDNSEYPVVADGDSSISAFAGSSGHKSGWSFVSTPNQNYDVSPSAEVKGDYEFTLTNKRVGVEKIVLNKTWVDGKNVKSTRPESITFTVTASETVFDGGTTASKDFTLTPDKNGVWGTLDTSTAEGGGGWFQKYDSSTGAYISYSIAEKSLNYGKGTDYTNLYSRVWSHEGEGLGYKAGDYSTGDVDTYALTNSLSGTIVPCMNKLWKDKNDTEAQKKRPDISPVLYRSYTDGTGIHYEKMAYQDHYWETSVKGHDNWWQCSFAEQPRFNAEGYEYTYYAGEEFSSTNTNDYACSGAYDEKPAETGNFDETGKTKTQISLDGGKTKIDAAKVSVTTDDTGKTTVTAGTIVNKAVNNDMTVSGSKVWTNLPAGFNKANLPDVTFELWRYQYGQTEAGKVKVTDSEGNAVTTTLKSGSTNFIFDGTFPRYDSEGKPYTYIVTETNPTTMVAAYDVSNNITNGLVVTNSFKADQNFGVTFTKNWEWPEGYTVPEGEEPSVTMTLSRYLTDTAGNIIDGTRGADFATAAVNGNANTVTLKYAGDNTRTLNWTHLAYYGPNGNPYKYEVEETNVPNGYVVYPYDPGTGTTGDTAVPSTTISGTTAYVADVTGSTTSGTAGLTNKYGEVLGSVNVLKSWSGSYDYSISSISQKPSVTLKLWRWSYSDTKETPVDLVSGKDITLNGEETPNAWQKVITGLEIYAPNGNFYWYILTEGADSELLLTSSEGPIPRDTAVRSSVAPTGFTVTNINYEIKAQGATISVTNSPVTTSLSVTKAWTYDDGTETVITPSSAQMLFGSALSAIPTGITYGFLYSTDGSTWNILKDSTAAHNAVMRTVTQSGGSFAAVTLDNLPAYILDANGNATAVSYKAYEISATYGSGSSAVTVNRADGNIDNSADIGSLSTSGSTVTGKTSITNRIPMQKLTITKNWADENNRDGQRSSSLAFTVTRTGVNNATDKQEATVTLTRNTDGKVTASSNGATWDATVSNDGNAWSTSVYVPTYRNDAKENSTYNVSETAISGEASYSSTVSNSGLDYTFTNTHVHRTYDVAVAKVWTAGSDSYDGTSPIPESFQNLMPDKLTFELQAEVTDENGTVTTSWADINDSTVFNGDFSGFTGVKTPAVTKADGKIEDTKWTGLPAYAPNSDTGRLTYHYRVLEKRAVAKDNNFTRQYSYPEAGLTAGGTVTVTNAFETTKLVINNETWDDQKNKYNSRPDAVKYTINYSADGSSWTNVPKGWIGSTEDGVLTVSKSQDGSYSATIDTLPKYADDGRTKYQYRASEMALVYGSVDVVPGTSADDVKPYYVTSAMSSSEEDAGTVYTAAITNTMVCTTFGVTKKWIDTAPGIAGQVSKITYYLQQSTDNGATWKDVAGSDGTKNFWTITTDSAADASVTTENLPKYAPAPDGTLYQYRAIEYSITTADGDTFATNTGTTPPTTGTVGGFTDVTSPDGTITNTAVTASVTASKTWADNGNAHGTRPTSVTYHLLQNGTDLGTTYRKTLSGGSTAAKWNAVMWEKLPKANAAGTAYTYTVTEDTVPGYTSVVTGTGTAAEPYVITNTPIPVKIAKVNVNDDGKSGTTPISGATLQIEPVNGVTFTDNTTAAKTWISNGSNWDLSGLLRDSTTDGAATTTYDYMVTETASPNGYGLITTGENATNRYIHLRDGKLYYISASRYGNSGFSWVAADSTNTVSLPNAQTGLSLSKTAPGGSALAGAAFRIDGTFVDATDSTKTTTVPITWTSTTSTYTLTGRLIAGETYKVTETAAPAGYLAVPDFTVTMGEDGRLTPGALPDGASGTVTVSYDEETAANLIKVQDKKTSFTLDTVDGSAPAKRLSGAEYTVHGVFSDSNNVASDKTWDDKSTAWTGLLAVGNTYSITETVVPAGCKTAGSPFSVRVGQDGKLEAAAGTTLPSGITVSGDGIIITAAHSMNVFTVSKTDTNSVLIAGASFSLAGTFAGTTASPVNWTSSGAVQSFSGMLIAGKEYRLTETVPADGYVLSPFTDTYADAAPDNAALVIKMDSAGQLSYKKESGWTAIVDNAIEMKDAPQTDVGIDLQNSSGTPISGVKLSVMGTTLNGNAYPAVTWTSGTGSHTISKLPAGTYTLTEERPADGYQMAAPVVFVKTDDGKVTVGGKEQADHTVIMQNADQTDVSVRLLNSDGNNNIAGAVLTVTGTTANGNAFSAVSWTSGTGAYMISKLPAGEYTLTEEKAADGYQPAASLDFAKTADGKVTVSGIEKADRTVIMQNQDQTDLKVSLVDNAGAMIAGASLTVTGTTANGNPYDTGSWSSETAAHVVSKLPAGSYTLKEMKPADGYQKADSITFVKTADGRVTIDDTEQSGNMIVMKNADQESVSFSLTDSSGKELTGAVLTVSGTTANNNAYSRTLTADGQPLRIERMPAGSYTLAETVIPDGYRKADNIDFTVTDKGTVFINGTASQGNMVTMKNSLISVAFSRTDKDGAAVSGITIRILGADGKTAENIFGGKLTWMTGTDASHVVEGVGAGSYTIHEDSVPNGYDAAADISLTIGTDNVLKCSVPAGKAMIVKTDSDTVTWAVNKSTNAWTAGPSINGVFAEGSAVAPTAVPKYGTAVITYSDAEDGTYTATVPTDPGVYYMKAAVAGTDDYCSLSGGPLCFAILPEGKEDVTMLTQVVVQKGIPASVITGDLVSSSYNTPVKIEVRLKELVKPQLTDQTAVDQSTSLCDISGQVSFDDGKTWITDSNILKDVRIPVVIPYPDGTSRSANDFVVVHMFAADSDVLHHRAGETEQPPVSKEQDGLHAVFNGLSPVIIAWTKAESPSVSGSSSVTGSGGGNDEAEICVPYADFNKAAAEQIRTATQGAAVTVSTPVFISFTRAVIEQLSKRPDVTLVVKYKDPADGFANRSFTIPAGTDLSRLENSGYYGFQYIEAVLAQNTADSAAGTAVAQDVPAVTGTDTPALKANGTSLAAETAEQATAVTGMAPASPDTGDTIPIERDGIAMLISLAGLVWCLKRQRRQTCLRNCRISSESFGDTGTDVIKR